MSNGIRKWLSVFCAAVMLFTSIPVNMRGENSDIPPEQAAGAQQQPEGQDALPEAEGANAPEGEAAAIEAAASGDSAAAGTDAGAETPAEGVSVPAQEAAPAADGKDGAEPAGNGGAAETKPEEKPENKPESKTEDPKPETPATEGETPAAEGKEPGQETKEPVKEAKEPEQEKKEPEQETKNPEKETEEEKKEPEIAELTELGTADLKVSFGTDVSAAVKLLSAKPEGAKGPVKLMAKRRSVPAQSKTEYIGLDIAPAKPEELPESKKYRVHIALDKPVDLLAGEEGVTVSGSDIALYHVAEGKPERVEASFTLSEDGRRITGFTFETDGFSPYIIAYTVEFRYEDKVYTLEVPGAEDIALSGVLAKLGILGEKEKAREAVAAVSVSNPEVFRITDTEDDWILRVLKASETPETLTVTGTNGRNHVITLAAEGVTEVKTEDGKTAIRTVNDWYLPEETRAFNEKVAEETKREEAIRAVREENRDLGEESGYRVFSVGLEGAEASEYEGFTVGVELEQVMPGKDFRLYRVKDGKAEEIRDSLRLEGEEKEDGRRDLEKFSFTTEDFTQYVLCYTLVTYYTAFDGTDYRIALSYGEDAGIPEGAALAVEEILPEQEAFAGYLRESAEKLGVSENEVTFARFFDIQIKKDGETLEPKAPVQVTISYADPIKMSGEASLSVVHFASEGTEVIRDLAMDSGNREITYSQDSFSVTGTIVTNPTAPANNIGTTYILIAKCDGKYYAVQSDGTLLDAESVNSSQISTDHPMAWKYVDINGKHYLRYAAEGYDFDWTQQATNIAYTYIDPTSLSGMSTDEVDHVAGGKTYFNSPTDHCDIVLDGTKIRLGSGQAYIAVDETKTHIVGNLNPAEDQALIGATEFYLIHPDNFVEYTGDWDAIPRFNLVNHIDISIKGKAKETVPLAYGKYYDAEGKTVVLTVDEDHPASVEITNDNIAVKQENIRLAKLTAFTIDDSGIEHNLDNAFYISGYTSNNPSGPSTAQVRIEGMFKVANIADINDGRETNSEVNKAKRRIPSNIVHYRLEATEPNVVFNYVYPGIGQLYDKNGKPYTITGNVVISDTFDYWDERNECPPIQKYWNEGDYNNWRTGGILRYGTSGMDFKLSGEAKIELKHVAVEITKYIVSKDEDGNTVKLSPKEDLKGITFNLHQKEGSGDELVDLNVGKFEKDPDYSDYMPIKTDHVDITETGEGRIHDYRNLKDGITYIEEDKDTIPDAFEDKDGVIWKYKETYFETEYVWRKDGDEKKSRHISNTYTKDSGELRSIPEILGAYVHEGDPLFNEFLEFYVYNVYEKVEPEKKETVIKHGNKDTAASLEETRKGEAAHGRDVEVYNGVQAGDQVTYEITFENYNGHSANVVITDELDANVKFISADPATLIEPAAGDVTTVIESSDQASGGTVKWTVKNVPAKAKGKVRLTVEVLEGAETAEKINNQASVKVGDDPALWTNDEENPVPEKPEKQETRPYEGNGELGAVRPGDEITYEISYKNYKTAAATVVITDKLDSHVKFVSASDPGAHTEEEAGGTVTWTLENVEAGKTGKVTLTVKVLKGALESEGGPGKVVNGGETATVKVGNDNAFTLETVENPVPKEPHKKETDPYKGDGVLGGVKVGQKITYKIDYHNYKDDTTTVVVTDKLDEHVEYVSATGAAEAVYDKSKHTVTWTIANAAEGDGFVTLTVKVLEGALESNGGPGKVVNGGKTATVKVGNDNAFTLEKVENPVPEEPQKRETAPYGGTGELGGVKVGDEITYEINYYNYKAEKADVTIKDTLDQKVEFVSADNGGTNTNGVVTWTLKDVEAGASGKVTLKVRVLEGALKSKGGPGRVVNGGNTATVQVGNDQEFTLNKVENPVPEVPEKKETDPYGGTGELGAVNVGDVITYTISYENYKKQAANIAIRDTLDANVEFVEASNGGECVSGIVNWTLKDVPAGTKGTVTLKVKVLESALESKAGPGRVVNDGDKASVKVGNDNEFTLNDVENPVPDKPKKEETSPYKGTGELGGVKVGDKITYEISYKNYKKTAAAVTITDKLDANVEFVEASNGGTNSDGVVTWTLPDVAAGEEGSVTLTVKVLEGALKSKKGLGKVVNGGETATVQVGNDPAYTLDTVENPVPEVPEKKETDPYEGNGVLGAVKVGDKITYEITYRNYKSEAAEIVIKDTLDPNVLFVSADNGGKETGGTVTWTIKNVPAGTEGKVTLTVKVLAGALSSNRGAGKVVNGGDTASVKVGNDNEFTLNTVENPVPDVPEKKETSPDQGTGLLKAVNVGDEITYEISYKNYKTAAATVVITDKLDNHVKYVSSSDSGTHTGEEAGGTVTWTLEGVEAGKSGKVTLKVKVLEGALEINGGPGKVVNGGDGATVKVGNDNEYTLNTVENPVPKDPVKAETKPYEGTGVLGAVNEGETITYTISYKNYKTTAADIVIKDQLDANVKYVTSDPAGTHSGEEAGGTVTWTLSGVAAGAAGSVTLEVEVLPAALKKNGGPGKVVNGGNTSTVKIDNDTEFKLNTVENPVPKVPRKEETAPYQGIGVLGAVKVGDEITYEISYKNYKDAAADIVIEDQLDANVKYVSSDPTGIHVGEEAGGTVTWTIKNVAAGKEGKVTLTVRVLESALTSKNVPGKVVNGGDTATVKVGNDKAYTLNTVENPVPEKPEKKETAPYEGTGVLGGVKVGDVITYEISYKNYKTEAADIVIKDKLDTHVQFVEASDGGAKDSEGVVTWTLKNVAAGKSGTVTLSVKVLESALASKSGPGKVVNGGNTASVKVGNDNEYTLNTVENPVPEVPNKQETAPYEGNGVLGAVKVGDEITYEISYKNYKAEAADIVIKDTLDKNVSFVKADNGGTNNGGVVTWTIENVEAGKDGKVTLKVKVLEGALASKNGPGKVVNGGDNATVKVGNDHEYTLNEVENPVPEVPEKKETVPYKGTGELGAVKVGDEITYEISYRNYKAEAANIVIKDTLDSNVKYVNATDGGAYDDTARTVTWNLVGVSAGKEGTVTLKVKVLEGALSSKGGEGKVVNGGNTASVKVGNDNEYKLNEVENPVPEVPHKQETSPEEGNGERCAVKVGDKITYEISYKNYKKTAAAVTIRDKLDPNVEFVSASDDGKNENGVVTWTLPDVAAGKEGTVTLTVKVLEGALQSKGGPGKVVNNGETASVKVGNDQEYTLDTVENPVPEIPVKRETAPYEGNGVLGGVKVGDEITYEISYRNYKSEAATVAILDKLDPNVEFVSASNSGKNDNGTVEWELAKVPAGKDGKVTLTVRVLEKALESNGGLGKVVNGGKTASVKVGNDQEYTLDIVENPVPEVPEKKETAPYEGNGVLGGVKVGEEITYEISYKNYKAEAADIVIKDTLDKNVSFVKADNDGKNAGGVVTWTIKGVAAGKDGKVTLTVKVLEGALESKKGPGKVVNGGDGATVKVGNDNEYTLNEVENPVPEVPHKQEVKPYEGNGVLGGVKVGDEITYEISYKNYKAEAADIVIKDTLDKNVSFVKADNGGKNAGGVVTWTIKGVAAGKSGKVTLTVKVLEGALESKKGPGKVVNGGDGATVKVGNDNEYKLNEVENPVPEVPHKQEVKPYEGNGVLGAVKVGDELTYEISYKNYKAEAADIVIKDTLDKNVSFVKADNGGKNAGGVVTWTIKGVAAGKSGKVTLTVKVLESALTSKNGPGKVVNNGETASVQVGNDSAYTLDTVENPVPEKPGKKETAPFSGTGKLGAVKVGDEITYEISYKNYKAEAADVVIKDTLDKNVSFVSADNGGKNAGGVVTWTIKGVAAGKSGKVTLKVKVLEGALTSKKGPGKVVNGGDSATVKVGNDREYTLDTVENPVQDKPKNGGGGTPEKDRVSVTVKKVWNDANNAAGVRPESIRVTLSNGNSYILSEENGWTVTVQDLPMYDEDDMKIEYSWTEQRVSGYRQTRTEEGYVTTLTNTFLMPPSIRKGGSLTVLEDYETALGINAIINHVGDCYE